MFAVLSTAWVVPGLVGPVLAERVSDVVGWRWVFLGLVPLVAVAGAMVVPAMMRLGPVGGRPAAGMPFWRRRMVEAVTGRRRRRARRRQLHASRWLLVPGVVGGLLVGLGPLSRLTPPGTLRARPGLPAVILSRGLLTFAFFGADTFVPYALHNGRGASVFAGSVAVTMATLSWTIGTWIQDRWIGRTGEAHFVRLAYTVLLPAIVVVALGALPDLLPFWVIHVGWAIGGLGIGLGYAAHSQLTLRCAPASEYGAATASLQLLDNLGVALGTGAVGVVVTLGDDLGWAAGDATAVALIPAAAVAALGLVVSRRLPARPPPHRRSRPPDPSPRRASRTASSDGAQLASSGCVEVPEVMDQSTTLIVPRWEWRTFGTTFGAAEEILAGLAPTGVAESDELYLLSDGVTTSRSATSSWTSRRFAPSTATAFSSGSPFSRPPFRSPPGTSRPRSSRFDCRRRQPPWRRIRCRSSSTSSSIRCCGPARVRSQATGPLHVQRVHGRADRPRSR